MILDAHTQGVDEDGEEYALLEILVFYQTLDAAADRFEAGGAARGEPSEGNSVGVAAAMPLRHPAALQHHGPVPTTLLLAAAEIVHLVFWAIAPSRRSTRIFPKSINSCRCHVH